MIFVATINYFSNFHIQLEIESEKKLLNLHQKEYITICTKSYINFQINLN